MKFGSFFLRQAKGAILPHRQETAEKSKTGFSVAIVVLAAGKASRMGADGRHKLLAEFDGLPLVRRTAIAACQSAADAVVVITGHRHLEISAAVEGLDLHCVYNADYASGMAGSLIAGLRSKSVASADGMLVLHADMPGITTADLDMLIAVFRDAKGVAVVRATSNGKRGNPVILPRSLFEEMLRLEGDVGARGLIETSSLPIIDVDIGEAALLDVDTPEAVTAAGGILKE